ncbi:MAG TPA: alpha/beta fold hydrolase [Candidatus Obscuribacterales bacterium]
MPSEINLTPTAASFSIGAPDRPITGRSWGTATQCRAAVLLVHGLGAHSGWFEAFGRRLKVRRMFAAAIDLTAHGKRKNQKLMSWRQWVDDIGEAARYIRGQTTGKPFFLMGNSLGAALALAAVEAATPDGLVLFSPGLDGYPGTFTITYRVQAIAKAIFSPDSEINLPYTDDVVSREESVKAWIDKDPDRRNEMPARMALELLKLSRYVTGSLNTVSCPVLMMTAGVDRVVNNTVNDRYFARLACPSKKRRHFDQAWHDLMFDPVIDELTDEVVSFMSECAPEKILAGS